MQTGKFPLQENKFYIGSSSYLIRERKKAGNKPRFFVIQIKPKFKYISSLFPRVDKVDTYTLDYEEKVYLLQVNKRENVVELKEKE